MLAAIACSAESMPAHVHIVYQARLGALPIGKADQRWILDNGRYTLTTELTPILGPRVRYLSHGEVGKRGLVPADYAEFRNNETTPRRQVQFDWPHRLASFGTPDNQESGDLEQGAQELNVLPFQLAWLGDKAEGKLQIATGRKLRIDNFQAMPPSHLNLAGKQQETRVWRAGDGDDRTEVWLAPALNNLPVKIIRSDDRGELQLVAQIIEIEPEKP
jgi:hypothetical protein